MDIEGSVKLEKIDEELIRNIAKYATVSISPSAAFFGGILA